MKLKRSNINSIQTKKIYLFVSQCYAICDAIVFSISNLPRSKLLVRRMSAFRVSFGPVFVIKGEAMNERRKCRRELHLTRIIATANNNQLGQKLKV